MTTLQEIRQQPLALPWRTILHWTAIAALAVFWLVTGILDPHLEADGAAYWGVRDGVLYEYGWLSELAGDPHPYVYSPAFAQVILPFAQLPLEAFMALLVGIQIVALVWLVGVIPAALLAFLVPAVGFNNVWAGGLYVLMAAALSLSLRFPGLWAFQLLTKVTPGVGIVWHLVRREWRALAWAVGATAAIVAASWLVWPAAWSEWVDVLRTSSAREGYPPGALPVPLIARLPVAAGIVAVAAWRDRRWLLPVGVMLAMPQLGLATAAILLAIPRLSPPGGRSPWRWRRCSTACSS